MKRMKKKVVAMVTLAMFVLSMVPMAAFASNAADEQTSVYQVVEAGQTVDTETVVATEFLINDSATNPTDQALANVVVWATVKGSDVPSSAVKFYNDADASDVTNLTASDNYTALTKGASNEQKLYAKFVRGGEYVLHAGVQAAGKVTEFPLIDEAQNTVVVEAAKLVAEKLVVPAKTNGDWNQGTNPKDITINSDGKNPVAGSEAFNGAVLTVGAYGNQFLANGLDSDSITFVVKDEKGNVVRGAEFNVSANKAGINVADTVTSDNQGNLKVAYNMTKAGEYKVYVENADMQITINIKKNEKAAEIANIENTTKDAKTLLACGDKNNGANGAKSFENAVQFTITDTNGEAVATDAAISGQKFANATKDTKYIVIDQKPEKSTLKAEDLKVVWNADKEAYTLALDTSKVSEAAKKLIAGDYKVTVKLNNGKSAVAEFTLANFGKVESLAVEVENGADVLANEVAAGTTGLKVKVYNVDAAGLQLENSVAGVRIDGDAVDKVTDARQFDVKAFDKELVGSEIVITAFDNKTGKFAETKLTVVKDFGENTVAFDSEVGKVNANNKVVAKVVDAKGNAVGLGNNVYVYTSKVSNENAKVEVSKVLNSDGKATLTIFSDKVTNVELQVVFVDNTTDPKNPKFYAKTLNYTINADATPAEDMLVAVTVGSSDYIVNNDIVKGDAAPYIKENRTFVPLRAVTEAFGADVVYNAEDNSVTVELDGTTVVMTIGSKDYTVDGEKKTMDVAPEAKAGRTYLPGRFLGEAFGFKVNPLTSTTGDVTVVFQR